MPEVFIGEFDSDIVAPTIVNRSPAPASTNVAESVNVSFDVLDEGSGINIATMDVDVDGTPALVNGVTQLGFLVAITPVVDGFHVEINPNTDFQSLSSISVSVFVQDSAAIANSASSSWNFATGDFKPPTIVNKIPVPGSFSVPVSSHVSFDALDVNGSGINPATVNVFVNGEDFVSAAVVNGVFQTGYTGSITTIVDGVHVDVVGTQPLLYFELYTVVVSVSDNGANVANASWQFNTDEGVVETPRLFAVSGLDTLVSLYWTTNQALRVTRFELRRSLAGYPTLPAEGELVYQGLSRSHNDIDVVNGEKYFYTLFAVRKIVALVPQYVPYDPLASAEAVPAAVVTSLEVEPEYIPLPGDFGPRTVQPVPHGRLISVWGQNGSRSDLMSCLPGREILSPVRGRVTETGRTTRGRFVVVSTDTGMAMRLEPVSVIDNLVSDLVIEPGQLIGRSTGEDVSFSVTKLPSAGFGRRTVRPSYFYLTVERRS